MGRIYLKKYCESIKGENGKMINYFNEIMATVKNH